MSEDNGNVNNSSKANDSDTLSTSFLGTGWGFPPTFSKEKRGVGMISDEEDIQSSLKILLSTRVGERIMQPKYGCSLDHLLFEPLNTTMKTYIKGLIRMAILHFEPRIEVNAITLETAPDAEGRIDITISYTIRATNSRYNLVYPFYRYEASGI